MNNDEPRLGVVLLEKIGLVELNDGRLTQLEFHDVYEYDNRFFEIPLPVHELEGLAENWRLRDSNTSGISNFGSKRHGLFEKKVAKA